MSYCNSSQYDLHESSLIASQSFSRVHSELLQAVAGGKLTGLEDLITRKIALEEFVDKGIKALIEEKDSQSKTLIHYYGKPTT